MSEAPMAFQITKDTNLAPLGLEVGNDLLPGGGRLWSLKFLISPFETVTVRFGDDAKDDIVRELTGGIVLP